MLITANSGRNFCRHSLAQTAPQTTTIATPATTRANVAPNRETSNSPQFKKTTRGVTM